MRLHLQNTVAVGRMVYLWGLIVKGVKQEQKEPRNRKKKIVSFLIFIIWNKEGSSIISNWWKVYLTARSKRVDYKYVKRLLLRADRINVYIPCPKEHRKKDEIPEAFFIRRMMQVKKIVWDSNDTLRRAAASTKINSCSQRSCF